MGRRRHSATAAADSARRRRRRQRRISDVVRRPAGGGAQEGERERPHLGRRRRVRAKTRKPCALGGAEQEEAEAEAGRATEKRRRRKRAASRAGGAASHLFAASESSTLPRRIRRCRPHDASLDPSFFRRHSQSGRRGSSSRVRAVLPAAIARSRSRCGGPSTSGSRRYTLLGHRRHAARRVRTAGSFRTTTTSTSSCSSPTCRVRKLPSDPSAGASARRASGARTTCPSAASTSGPTAAAAACGRVPRREPLQPLAEFPSAAEPFPCSGCASQFQRQRAARPRAHAERLYGPTGFDGRRVVHSSKRLMRMAFEVYDAR